MLAGVHHVLAGQRILQEALRLADDHRLTQLHGVLHDVQEAKPALGDALVSDV